MLKHNHIPLQGTPNFRELGGYPTKCGRHIAYGKFFRSGVLSYLTQQDWAQIQKLNIATIVDFRRAPERHAETTKLPANTSITIIESPIDSGDHRNTFKSLLDNNQFTVDAAQQIMRNINIDLALHTQSTYKQFLDSIFKLKDTDSILFHCSAGKDRTGFAAALILMCLNVDSETIYHDYLLSLNYFKPQESLHHFIKNWAGNIPEGQYQPDAFLKMLGVQQDYLQAAFDAIDQHYSSTEEYLEDCYGLGSIKLEQFRNRFLEPSQ